MADSHPQTQPMPSLTRFFVATFALSWSFWIPGLILFGDDLAEGSPLSAPVFIVLQTLGAAGPSVAAYLLLRQAAERKAIQSIARRYKLWRFDFRWYLVAALLVPSIQLGGLLVGGLLEGGPFVEPDSPLAEMLGDLGIPGAVALFPVIVVAQLPSSPLLEEFGWRGFALPRLQDRYSALASSMILGFIWGLWHLPLTLVYGDPVVPFLLRITAISVLITWVFNNTRGSMLLAMLFHASLNASIVPLSTLSGRWPGVLLAVAVAALVALVKGGTNLAAQPRFRWSVAVNQTHRVEE